MWADPEAFVAELTGNEEAASAGTEGPDVLSDAPTIIGVGEIRGLTAGAVGLATGIEFVTTTRTGVGVGSTRDCESAGRLKQTTDSATHKSLVFIRRLFRILRKGVVVVQALVGPRR